MTLTCGLLLAGMSLHAQSERSIENALTSISASGLRSVVEVLADDSMLGRQSPSPDVERTAAYIAGQLQAYGLKPLGDAGSYLQRYPLAETRWDLSVSGLDLGNVWMPLGETAQLIGTGGEPPTHTTGSLIYLSGALESASSVEYMDLAGHVVMFYYPTGSEGEFSAGFQELVGAMFAKRAAGVVVITDRSRQNFSSAAAALKETTFRPAWTPTIEMSPGMAILEIRRPAVVDALREYGIDISDASAELSGPPSRMVLPSVEVSVRLEREVVRRHSSPNVVAFLQGSDSTMMGEYVVFIAHMDGIGYSSPDAQGDSIFNSADDNASGTAALLALARGFAILDQAPRRSVLFLATSSNEDGLWGSRYFVDNSPVPTSAMIAAINADMIGRSWSKDTVAAIGADYSEIGAVLDSVAAARDLGIKVTADRWPEQNYFFRSDHLPFAQAGIPSVLFMTSGPHEMWHRRSDHAEDLDYSMTARVTRLMMSAGIAIANGRRRPLWYPNKYSEIVAMR